MFRTALISMFLTSAALADTWTVDDDGKADFDNIQAAVDASSDGDEIIVMPGTYTSTQDGHVVNMLGKAVTLRSTDPSNPHAVATTIIDGEGARRGIACFNGETNKTVIEGLTITNGFGVEFDYDGSGDIGWWEDDGGGMINYSSSNPTLTDCTFENNTAVSYGGGMYNANSSPTLTNCTFTGNTVETNGGGMWNIDSSPTLDGCTFTNNSANRGGGMYNYYNSPTLTNCTFTNNSADSDYEGGGGMFNNNSNPMLTDCTFEGNSANSSGGMFNLVQIGYKNPTLTDTTVCGNTPDQINGDWTDNGGNMIADECPGDTWTVDDDGKADFDNIQAAVDASSDGDEIIVMPGTYSYAFDHTVLIEGKSIWLHSSEGADVTFIDGQNAGRTGIKLLNGSGTTIEGFTIQNCDWPGWGGGLKIEVLSDVEIVDCVIKNNTADRGGGIYISASNPVLINTIVCGNLSWLGEGQIYGVWTDGGGNTIADECPIDCPDINGDGYVNVSDLLTIIDQWGQSNSPADVNFDSIVDVTDLLIVIGSWGPCE